MSSLIDRFLAQENIRSIYKRNIYLARVEAAFQFAQPNSASDEKSSEFEQLCRYIDVESVSPACFEDVKGFAERLSPQEIKELAYEYVPRLAKETEDASKSAAVRTLAFKLQYLGLSSSKTIVPVPNDDPKKANDWKCIVCSTSNKSSSCTACLKTLLESALSLYSSLINSSEISQTLDCIPELAILAATCLVRLSGLHERGIDNPTSLSKTSRQDRLLQAAIIIEDQLTRTPKHTRLTLVLVRIYLVLGCASRAREVWDTADVKRTIIDSLGPYFFDRLSTVAPTLVLPPNSPGRALMQGLKAHYQTSLKLRMPRRLADAFDSESYTAILDIPGYIERLRRSCTLVMGYVEESRAGRALDVRSDSVFDEPAVGKEHLPLNSSFMTLTHRDRGDCRRDRPKRHYRLRIRAQPGSIDKQANLGRPAPRARSIGKHPLPITQVHILTSIQNIRSHLALSAESFFDLLSYKAPSSYKVNNAAQAAAAEQTYILESLQRLNTSMSRFLHARGTHLTQQEEMYYDIISLLTSLIPLAVSASRAPPPPELLSSIASAVKAGLDVLRAQALAGTADESQLLLMLGSLHGLFVLRDAAAAVKLATSYIVAFNEREKERDRSGQSNIPKDVMAHVKTLEAAAATALKEGKARVAFLKKESDSLGARLGRWTFEAEDGDKLAQQIREAAGGHVGVWTQKVADSWRTNVKGWEMVQWE